jgi:DNA-binding winged helix-turn-helix (wHTH) protein
MPRSRVEIGVDVVKFGNFEVHLKSAELYRLGRLVRLQRQPFEVLRALVEEPGALVTREALRKRLWPDGVTVDFDQSLNKCLTKLRDALGDTAGNPRFIETLPKRGYRLIAPVSGVLGQPAPAPIPAAVTPQAGSTPPTEPPAATVSQVQTSRQSGVLPPPADESRKPLRRLWVPLGLLSAVVLITTIVSVMPNATTGVEARTESAPVVKKPATTSPIFAARDAYERGQLALVRRTHDSLKLSVEHFERAIAMSPRYADAYVGLADSWSLMSSYGLVDPREGMPRARDGTRTCWARAVVTTRPFRRRAGRLPPSRCR